MHISSNPQEESVFPVSKFTSLLRLYYAGNIVSEISPFSIESKTIPISLTDWYLFPQSGPISPPSQKLYVTTYTVKFSHNFHEGYMEKDCEPYLCFFTYNDCEVVLYDCTGFSCAMSQFYDTKNPFRNEDEGPSIIFQMKFNSSNIKNVKSFYKETFENDKNKRS